MEGDCYLKMVQYMVTPTNQSWVFKKHIVKRKRKFRNQNF